MESREEWRSRTGFESKGENWSFREKLDPAIKEAWTK